MFPVWFFLFVLFISNKIVNFALVPSLLLCCGKLTGKTKIFSHYCWLELWILTDINIWFNYVSCSFIFMPHQLKVVSGKLRQLLPALKLLLLLLLFYFIIVGINTMSFPVGRKKEVCFTGNLASGEPLIFWTINSCERRWSNKPVILEETPYEAFWGNCSRRLNKRMDSR